MHRFDTFPELRAGGHKPNGEITLWPSFTDIMTVVLMIFMLTMIVVIIKNTNLARALLASEDQGRKIEDLLRQSQTAEAELKVSLAEREEMLRQKQMRIILLSDEAKLLQQDLAGKTALIATVESQAAALKDRIVVLEAAVAASRAEADAAAAALATKVAELTRQYDARIAELQASSEKKLAALTEAKAREIEENNRKVLALLSQLKEKEAVIVSLGGEKQALELSLAKQRQDFSSLEEKYIRLIRPARSTAGKKVVTVYYQRQDGQYRTALKGVDSEKVQTLTMDQLHRQLAALKQQWQDQLYVRIVIPEDSGLTYNEAWIFTKEILSRYDYYYRE